MLAADNMPCPVCFAIGRCLACEGSCVEGAKAPAQTNSGYVDVLIPCRECGGSGAAHIISMHILRAEARGVPR